MSQRLNHQDVFIKRNCMKGLFNSSSIVFFVHSLGSSKSPFCLCIVPHVYRSLIQSLISLSLVQTMGQVNIVRNFFFFSFSIDETGTIMVTSSTDGHLFFCNPTLSSQFNIFGYIGECLIVFFFLIKANSCAGCSWLLA